MTLLSSRVTTAESIFLPTEECHLPFAIFLPTAEYLGVTSGVRGSLECGHEIGIWQFRGWSGRFWRVAVGAAVVSGHAKSARGSSKAFGFAAGQLMPPHTKRE